MNNPLNNPYPFCINCRFECTPLDQAPCKECYRSFLAQRIKPNFVRKDCKHRPTKPEKYRGGKRKGE